MGKTKNHQKLTKTQNKTKLSLHMYHKVHYGIQAFKTGFKHFKTLKNERKQTSEKPLKSIEADSMLFNGFPMGETLFHLAIASFNDVFALRWVSLRNFLHCLTMFSMGEFHLTMSVFAHLKVS